MTGDLKMLENTRMKKPENKRLLIETKIEDKLLSN